MSHLKTLSFGEQLDAEMGADALAAVLTLPHLEHPTLDSPLDTALLAQLLAARNSCKILPKVKQLAIKCQDSEGLAQDILRANPTDRLLPILYHQIHRSGVRRRCILEPWFRSQGCFHSHGRRRSNKCDKRDSVYIRGISISP